MATQELRTIAISTIMAVVGKTEPTVTAKMVMLLHSDGAKLMFV